MNTLLVNTAYFPPVQYLSKITKSDNILIEQFEHYGKQSYRNRCEIMFANGIMSLTVPVIKASKQKILTKDVRIEYTTNWQKLHLKSIESAYKNSPFYDYYFDDFISFFVKKEKYLLDLNTHILQTTLDLFSLRKNIAFTEDYIKETNSPYNDWREKIHPKTSKQADDTEFKIRPYHQTFCERYPFTPNLSILDLLFNVGPEAPEYL